VPENCNTPGDEKYEEGGVEFAKVGTNPKKFSRWSNLNKVRKALWDVFRSIQKKRQGQQESVGYLQGTGRKR